MDQASPLRPKRVDGAGSPEAQPAQEALLLPTGVYPGDGRAGLGGNGPEQGACLRSWPLGGPDLPLLRAGAPDAGAALDELGSALACVSGGAREQGAARASSTGGSDCPWFHTSGGHASVYLSRG